MKKVILLLAMGGLAMLCMKLLTSCQTCTRQFGGTTVIRIPAGQRFINTTWKGNDIWVLTADTANGQYLFSEYSNFGVLQGKVIIKK